MENDALNIRSKRALLQLIKEQLISVYGHDMSMKRLTKLKKNKGFQTRAQWIDGFVQENFKDISVVKNKLCTRKEIAKRIIKKSVCCLLFVFALHQIASASYLYRAGLSGRRIESSPFLFVNVYTFLIATLLLVGLYVYIKYYLGLCIEKERKSSKIPIREYEYFLGVVKKRIETMSEKEVADVLKNSGMK
jgi:hypothetical protein